jgi:hypothetical protein
MPAGSEKGAGKAMALEGFHARPPANWNTRWILMWVVLSAILITLAFFVPFWPWWLIAAAIGFGIPEAISLLKKDDSLPPLTHTIRHFLPDWLAFPLIYGLLGTIGATWLGFPHPWRLGGLFGLLGWLTDHFSVTYSHPDPFPFSGGETGEPPSRMAV